MMMNFHGSTKKKRRPGKRILVLCVVVILALNVFDVVWPQTAARSLLIPVRVVREWFATPFVYIQSTLKSKADLLAENEALKEKLMEFGLQAMQTGIQQYMTTAVITEQSYGQSGQQALVLARPPYAPFDTLVLDVRGISIAEGDYVFSHGILIGEIARVDPVSAIAKLYTASDTKTVVKLVGLDVEAIGQGGGRYMATIPKDVAVTVGDVVAVPFAGYAPLGVVGGVTPDATGTFQNVHISLPVAFSALDVVTVAPVSVVLE